MSSKGGAKRKASRKSDITKTGGAPAPAAAKRPKHETPHSLLLNTRPEILRKVFKFLPLKDALKLCRVHRFFNNARNDIYQYSVIVKHPPTSRKHPTKRRRHSYLFNQKIALCNVSNAQHMRALLRNETLDLPFIAKFMNNLIEYSSTDNSQAVFALLEDCRCEVDVVHLEKSLKKGFTTMAAVLQKDERVKDYIQMCQFCSNNIGCFSCASSNECVMGDDLRYCRECVLKEDCLCKRCHEYLCPNCSQRGLYGACEKCDGIECLSDEHRQGEFLYECERCDRKKCKPCIEEDGGVWFQLEDGEILCRTCASTIPDDREIVELSI